MSNPRDLDEALARLAKVRDYAQSQRATATELRAIDRPYDALPYENTAAALERILGDRDADQT